MSLKIKHVVAGALAASLIAVGTVAWAAAPETETIVKVDINPGGGGSTPSFLTEVGDEDSGEYVYFTADDGVNGREIWFTDGTAAGTKSVGNINPGGNAINDERVDPFFHLLDGYVYYRANDGTSGLELYRSPLGQVGFEQISDLNSTGDGFYTISLQYWANPLAPMYTEDIVSHNGRLFFRGWNATSSIWQLYSYDPGTTPNGANAGLTYLSPNQTGSVRDLVVWNDAVHFVFKATGVESKLYKLAGANLTAEVVVSASVATQGNIYRLMPVGDKLLFLDTIGTSNADLRYITADAPGTSVAVTTGGPIKTDLGLFMRPTVIGSEIYFETTNPDVVNDLALRYVDTAVLPMTLQTVVGGMPSSTASSRQLTQVVAVGDARYVVHAPSAFSYNLYKLDGATLGSSIANAGDLISQLTEVGGNLVHQNNFAGDVDVALRPLGGPSVRTADSVVGAKLYGRQMTSIGDVVVISGAGPDWELWLLELKQATVGASPAPYTGPVVAPILGSVEPGASVVVTGSQLDQVTAASIDSQSVAISEQRADSLRLQLPQTLSPGVKDLELTTTSGKVTVQAFVRINGTVVDTAVGYWTQWQASTDTIKIYAKNPVAVGKVQFIVDGREIAWVRAVDATDPKLRVITADGPMAGVNYLVRTISLNPGKNRFEIRVDGQRVWRATYLPRG